MFKLKIEKFLKTNQNFIVAITIGIVVLLFFSWISQPSLNNDQKRTTDITSFVPKNMALIPIEILNPEGLDSILGKFGIIDLFTRSPRKSIEPLIRSVKVLRAPNNPSQFAVMVPSQLSSLILKHNKGFYVAVKGPDSGGTRFERPPNKSQSRISYEEE